MKKRLAIFTIWAALAIALFLVPFAQVWGILEECWSDSVRWYPGRVVGMWKYKISLASKFVGEIANAQ